VRNAGPPTEASRKIAAIRSIKSPQERMRATIALAYSLPSSELGEWIDKRWFISEPGFDLTLFNKIVNQRWAAEDPQGKLKLAIEAGEGYSSSAITAWAKQDPAGLVAWLKDNPNPNMESQALAELAKVDPALAITRLRELALLSGNDGYSNYYSSQALREIAARSPEALQAALASLPVRMRSNAEALLLGQRLNADPAGEVHALMQQPNGLKQLSAAMNNSEHREKIGDMLLAELGTLPDSWRKQIAQGYLSPITDKNAEKWFNTDLAAAGFSETEAKNLRLNAVSQVTYSNPKLAIKMLGELDLDDHQRRSMITNLFSQGREAKQNEELLALLANDEDRKVATDYIARYGMRNGGANGEIKAETPAEWFEAAQSFDPNNGSSSYYFMQAISDWDKNKLAELASEFRKLPDDRKKNAALALAGDNHISNTNQELRGEALRYLLSLPPAAGEQAQDPNEDGVMRPRNRQQDYSYTASSFAVQWSQKDPDAASQWVQSLPDGDGKLWVQKNLAMNWAKYDPEHPARGLTHGDREVHEGSGAELTMVAEWLLHCGGESARIGWR
jgi:hypothetical protein